MRLTVGSGVVILYCCIYSIISLMCINITESTFFLSGAFISTNLSILYALYIYCVDWCSRNPTVLIRAMLPLHLLFERVDVSTTFFPKCYNTRIKVPQ
ncbi:hypothetical protein NP493_16g06045 [Ridgeia piscesae]|uniref:Uncharacterized protein n=1 Tax=Ridgeia piscesae TaxID=27915 RepID=A0AAD9UL11_RIDPI|nr:hypothetical protein NP493_16g06045 [Ridgeia piscesae]